MNGTPVYRVVVVLAATLLFWGGTAMARQPVAMLTADEATILEWFLTHTESNAARVTPDALAAVEQPEDICWVWTPYTQMPLVAYQLTGDGKYLDLFVGTMDALLTRLARREHDWQGGVGAMGYLVGKYLAPQTAAPAQARYGDQFRQNADNAAFLQAMRYGVAAEQ